MKAWFCTFQQRHLDCKERRLLSRMRTDAYLFSIICTVVSHCGILTRLGDLLWPPCVADADIIFVPCGFFFFIPRLISAVADWMSTILLPILLHMVWF